MDNARWQVSTSNDTGGSDSVFVTASSPVLWVVAARFGRGGRDLRGSASRLPARGSASRLTALARVAAATSRAVADSEEALGAALSATKGAVGVLAAALSGGGGEGPAPSQPSHEGVGGGGGAAGSVAPSHATDARRRMSSFGEALKATTLKVARRVRGNTGHGEGEDEGAAAHAVPPPPAPSPAPGDSAR